MVRQAECSGARPFTSSSTRQLAYEPLDFFNDAAAGALVPVAHRRNVPLLDRVPSPGRNVTAEADHARRRAEVIERDGPWTIRGWSQPIAGESLHRPGRQFGIGLGP